MDIKEAIKERHSVRQYKDLPIPDEVKEELTALINECNEESGLNVQLITDDPGCFKTFLAHYGWFKNAQHYFALVGKKDLPDPRRTAVPKGLRIPAGIRHRCCSEQTGIGGVFGS